MRTKIVAVDREVVRCRLCLYHCRLLLQLVPRVLKVVILENNDDDKEVDFCIVLVTGAGTSAGADAVVNYYYFYRYNWQ